MGFPSSQSILESDRKMRKIIYPKKILKTTAEIMQECRRLNHAE